jgi:DNA-binding NtrC family response regulator
MQEIRRIRILTLGQDVSLLSSRINLLTQVGYQAEWETDQERALRRVRKKQYHLVVLSQTFTQEEQLGLRAQFKQTKPDLPVLLLNDGHRDAEEFLDAVADRLRRVNGSNGAPLTLGHPLRPKI